MNWDAQMLEELKHEYGKAIAEGKEEFKFRGYEMFVGYAKYLIEYLDGQMP